MSAAAKPKRARGRPRRADGLDPNSREARALRGKPLRTVSLPLVTVQLIDACAAAWGCTRPVVVLRALSAIIGADGIVPLDLNAKTPDPR